MAALFGFDTFVGVAEVNPPLLLGDTLISVPLPAKVTVGGIDMDSGVLDSAAGPTLALNVGDAADPDRFVAASMDAAVGQLLEYRPDPAAFHRYNIATAVTATVAALPTTAQHGAIAMTIYGYPSLDISDAARMVLQVLGVLAEGESARAADHVLAVGALEEIHERLRYKRLANRYDLAWPVTLIPVFAGRAYARMAADLLSDTFGVSAQRAALLAQRAAEGEREMRRQTQIKTTGQPVSLEPYQDPPPFILDVGVLG